MKMQSISVFVYVTKFADFWCENADVSGNQGCVTRFIYSFEFPLAKV